jgi:hypothetical protein
MDRALEVAGDVAAAGAALAGLILVYLGAVVASYASFDATAQKTVRARHQGRAWFAFAGLTLCLLSVSLALFAKWLAIGCMAVAALIILALALAWVLATAVLTIREIA